MAEPALDDVAQHHHLAERQTVGLQPLGLLAEECFEREEPVQRGDQAVAGQVGPLALGPQCRLELASPTRRSVDHAGWRTGKRGR